MTAGNSVFCDGLMVMPCAALLFGGSTIQFLFFPGEGHHHLAIGYDADAFIFPVGVVLLPMNNRFIGSEEGKEGGMCHCSLILRACI